MNARHPNELLRLFPEPCLLLLVAEGAINTGLLRFVAIDASTHRNIAFEKKLVALRNLPVASVAGAARWQVRSVAKSDIARNLVDASPPDLAIALRSRGQLLNLRPIDADLRVALHAG
jgi:hypothetical protein